MHTYAHACIYTVLSFMILFCLRTAAVLLKKGARTGIKDDDGKTPLHCATSHGHFETVKLLINNHADIDAAYVKRCALKVYIVVYIL